MNDLLIPSKITSAHLDRLAVVYVRQSDPQQRIRHPESALAQRRFSERIREWGWPVDRIRMLEGDSGNSATSIDGRDEFQWLLDEIMLDHIGLVAGFQINRLAREDETVCRLIKLCAVFNTLLADEDGLYHPLDFNDRFLLTIKGIVGSMELHQIQQRMQLGRLERARRGEWMGRMPMGYVLGNGRKLAIDPDEQVRHAMREVFACFDTLGSVSAMLRHFRERGLTLPIRVAKGPLKGRIEWRAPHRETLRKLLRNPSYAGAFAWPQTSVEPTPSLEGRVKRVCHAPQDCRIFLRENHEAYIGWDAFERNVARLSSHRQHGPQPSPRREVTSLLAGRVVCGHCGAKMQTHYGPTLRYECARRLLDYGEPRCASLAGELIERAAAEQILRALEPASLELSLAAAEQIEARQAAQQRGWQLRLEGAQQKADRAGRKYDAVEPENRLVARALESRWEAALSELRSLREVYDRFRAQQPLGLTAEQREAILALSQNLPALWNAPTTGVADKRRVVKLMLSQAVVAAHAERIRIELHWMGGSITHHEVTRPVRSWKDLSTYPKILKHIQEQAQAGKSSAEIAAALNDKGYRTTRNRQFTNVNIRQLRSRTGIEPTKPKTD